LYTDAPVVVQHMDQTAWTPIEPLPLAEPDPSFFLGVAEPPGSELQRDVGVVEPAEPSLSTVSRTVEPTGTPEPLAGDWALSGASAGEWVEAEPVVPPGGPIGGFGQDPLLQNASTQDFSPLEDLSPLPDLASFENDSALVDDAPPAAGAGESPQEGAFSGDGLRSLFGPDPVTGLATLPTLLGRLAEALVQVRNHEGSVAVVLLDVASDYQSSPLSGPALHAVAGRLSNRVRENDLVARVDTNLFAVLAHVREDGIDADTMRDRMVDAIVARADRSAGVLTARSAIAAAAPGDSISAEQLLRDAAESLGSP
jgi:GGDEF domain-containing protein